jgi:ferredoxin-NADP reductase
LPRAIGAFNARRAPIPVDASLDAAGREHNAPWVTPLPERRTRPPTLIDVAARCVAWVAPSSWTGAIDQARLDIGSVADQIAGRRHPPYRDSRGGPLPPTPLGRIDPLPGLLPRGAAHAYDRWRRDAATLVRGLQGHHPPPLLPRRRAGRRSTERAPGTDVGASNADGRAMTIAGLERLTPDAVEIVLEDPAGRPFAFRPGQFITVVVLLDGEQHRRAYSLCNVADGTPRAHIAVRRVSGGRVSSWLVDRAGVGDELRVLGPSGSFGPPPSDGAPRHLVLVAAGSGITPMMSIARAALSQEPCTRVSFLVGNRRESDIMFRGALEEIASRHADRLRVRHLLREPPDGWAGGAGVLDRETASRELVALEAAVDSSARFLVCGPEPMMLEVRAALAGLGIGADRVHEERFVQPRLDEAEAVRAWGEPHEVLVRGRAGDARVLVGPGQTLLEAALGAGVPMKFSCTVGGCGACKVKAGAGGLRMREPNCLSPEERARGEVLACVAHPVRDTVVESS